MSRVLVAGVGNVFLGDDGFGVAVARRLVDAGLPPDVEVVDVGIRSVHLAYQLLDGYDLLVLVDAAARGGPPGTLYVLEHGEPPADPGAGGLDPHDLTPEQVLATVARLGGRIGRTVVVGCEPAVTAPGMALSPAVAATVEAAAAAVQRIVREWLSDGSGGIPRRSVPALRE